jgi:glycosyltransferase involved in cell wall biosynthesis
MKIMSSSEYPMANTCDIDCVIIGVNAAATLARCIDSVLHSQFSLGKIYLYYVDGGSSDNSLNIARGYPEVIVIALRPDHPTPGMGRNAGWRAGQSPYVQFLDSDTVLHPQWFVKALPAMGPEIGAVCGRRNEMHPSASLFNMIGDLEWNAPPGECEAFGGDVMIRRSLLDKTGGYDEVLIAGEDPELSQRLRLAGFKIWQLDEPMTLHDLAMTRLCQYWKRGYRTGYGYAAVTLRFLGKARGFWTRELCRIIIRGGMTLALLILGLFGSVWYPKLLWLWVLATILLLFPRLFRLSFFMADKGISREQAKIYAWHCSLVVIPEFFGIVRFLVGAILGRPLRNNPTILATRS